MICGKNNKTKNFSPKHIEILKKDPLFADFSKEDLMVFYQQFTDITNGKNYLDKENFIYMLNSLNVN